jgi:helicase MOV-10
MIHSLERSDCVIKAGFPVVFHSIIGKDVREARSPSFFNVEEASLVKQYVDRLKTDKRLQLGEFFLEAITKISYMPYSR